MKARSEERRGEGRGKLTEAVSTRPWLWSLSSRDRTFELIKSGRKQSQEQERKIISSGLELTKDLSPLNSKSSVPLLRSRKLVSHPSKNHLLESDLVEVNGCSDVGASFPGVESRV